MILLLLLVTSMLTLIVVVHLLVCWKISPLIKILWFVISHHSVSSGANMSDHLPLSFQLHIPCASINTLPSSVSSKPKACINWSKVTPSTVMMYQQMVLGKLADPPVEFLQCSSPSCSVHASLLDNYASHFVSTHLDSCFPCHSASKPRVPGWNESAGKLKELSIFWNRVWTEAGCQSAGVLSTIKRHAKKRFHVLWCLCLLFYFIFFVLHLHWCV